MLSVTAGCVIAQKPVMKIKAFQRYYISGLPNIPAVEVGGKEVVVTRAAAEPEYYIYLVAAKTPSLNLESIWIKQHRYQASLKKISCKPVVVNNGAEKDTLVKYTKEDIWQVRIKGKAKTDVRPTKAIAALVPGNDLVVRVYDKAGRYYTHVVRNIPRLESARGQ
ncbi:MAG: hypothetical protein JWQ78_855 [Sediminibacterium sp.]|nr:hypothetical protein [Sediminibacterium sp.]